MATVEEPMSGLQIFAVGPEPSQQAPSHPMKTKKSKLAKGWSRNGRQFFRAFPQARKLPAASYWAAFSSEHGPVLRLAKRKEDDLFPLPETPVQFILDQIDEFWKRRKYFQQAGLIHKRGVLLYGEAGVGKTSVINLIADAVVRDGGIVVWFKRPDIIVSVLEMLRFVEPNRNVVTVCEDIDRYNDNDGDIQELLALYDGAAQIEHVLHIATTNFPERLQDRIFRRPGRFDLVVGVNSPTREARLAYLTNKFNSLIPEDKIEEIANKTDGLVLSHLREIVAACFCLGSPLDDTIERLRSGMKMISSKKKNQTGFTTNFPKEEEELEGKADVKRRRID